MWISLIMEYLTEENPGFKKKKKNSKEEKSLRKKIKIHMVH